MMTPHRSPTYAESTMRETLEARGWTPDRGGYKAPDGYGLLAAFTVLTAFEVETDLGAYKRSFPSPRPGLWRRLRFWYYGWELRRAMERERALVHRAANPNRDFVIGVMVGGVLSMVHLTVWVLYCSK
jgi:hypothetical protein